MRIFYIKIHIFDYVITVQMRLLQQAVCKKILLATARTFSHWRKALSMCSMWSCICAKIKCEEAYVLTQSMAWHRHSLITTRGTKFLIKLITKIYFSFRIFTKRQFMNIFFIKIFPCKSRNISKKKFFQVLY